MHTWYTYNEEKDVYIFSSLSLCRREEKREKDPQASIQDITNRKFALQIFNLKKLIARNKTEER